nr:immunoglobulin light chain junction region [Macaca mulatta]
CQHYYITPPSF